MTRSPSPSGSTRHDAAHVVDVALDEMPAERLAGPECGLDVDLVARLQPSERRPRERLGDRVEADRRTVDRLGGEARPADRDRVADRRRRCRAGSLDDEGSPVVRPLDRDDAADLPHDPREHRLRRYTRPTLR